MASHDTHAAMSAATSLILILNSLGVLLILVGFIAAVVMSPVHWVGVGIALFAGIYSMVMARYIGRREAKRSQ